MGAGWAFAIAAVAYLPLHTARVGIAATLALVSFNQWGITIAFSNQRDLICANLAIVSIFSIYRFFAALARHLSYNTSNTRFNSLVGFKTCANVTITYRVFSAPALLLSVTISRRSSDFYAFFASTFGNWCDIAVVVVNIITRVTNIRVRWRNCRIATKTLHASYAILLTTWNFTINLIIRTSPRNFTAITQIAIKRGRASRCHSAKASTTLNAIVHTCHNSIFVTRI